MSTISNKHTPPAELRALHMIRQAYDDTSDCLSRQQKQADYKKIRGRNFPDKQTWF